MTIISSNPLLAATLYIVNNTDALYLLSGPATTFSGLADAILAQKLNPPVTPFAEYVNTENPGQSIAHILPFEDGVVLSGGIASHYAVANTNSDELFIMAPLAAPLTLEFGGTFSMETPLTITSTGQA